MFDSFAWNVDPYGTVYRPQVIGGNGGLGTVYKAIPQNQETYTTETMLRDAQKRLYTDKCWQLMPRPYTDTNPYQQTQVTTQEQYNRLNIESDLMFRFDDKGEVECAPLMDVTTAIIRELNKALKLS